jgi:hypothetical protein
MRKRTGEELTVEDPTETVGKLRQAINEKA